MAKEGLRKWFSRNNGKGWIDCKTGKPCARKGLVILDETSRVTVEGWDNAWPSIYNTLQQGDEVAILNVSLDAWAVDVKANLEKGSTIHVISRADN